MILKKFKPITPGTRHQLISKTNELFKSSKVKKLIIRKKKTGGRNNSGKIVIRHRGGGYKKKIRQITWNNNHTKSIVVGIEYDPNRSSLLSFLFNLNQKKFWYTLAPKGIYPGAIVEQTNKKLTVNIGDRMPIISMPTGTILHAVGEKNSTYGRAAGTFCQLIQKNNKFIKIRIPSGELKTINIKSSASVGMLANEKHNLQIFGKAGKQRLKGHRPKVRGVAMNPVDHPHGGGGGRPSVTPWGKPTKGQKTRKKNKIYNK